MTMEKDQLFEKADKLHERGLYNEAFSLFLTGAESGDTSCMTRLACMYSCGEGVECDYDKALEWELNAIKLGDITAMVNAGITYRIKGELRESKHWFEEALSAGDGSGAIELAKLYMVSEKESSRVEKYLKIAVNHMNISELEIEEAERYLLEIVDKH